VPWCAYTDPEVAHVGLGEKEAKEKNIDYDLFVVPLVDVDRAVVESEDAGFAKILTAKGSDKILGAIVVAPHAGDLLHEFVLAMNAKIGLGRIASMIHAYSTFAELARKAGDKYNKTHLTPRAKKSSPGCTTAPANEQREEKRHYQARCTDRHHHCAFARNEISAGSRMADKFQRLGRTNGGCRNLHFHCRLCRSHGFARARSADVATRFATRLTTCAKKRPIASFSSSSIRLSMFH